jgi:hypothetical protein
MASIQIVSGLVLLASAGNPSLAREQQHLALVTAHDRCHVEVQTLCAGLPANTVLACLKAHDGQLSPGCQSALAGANARHSAQSAN